MAVYDIYQTTRNVVRYAVEADSPEHALILFEAGKATLKDDETTDVYGEEIYDRATIKSVTMEANEFRDAYAVSCSENGGWTVEDEEGERLPGAFSTEESAWMAALAHHKAKADT